MRIDDYDFDNTAKAVFVMNESAPTHYDTWEDLKSFMVSMSYTYMGKNANASFSTGGFCLTAYDYNGERVVRASVSSFVANRYIDRVMKVKQKFEKLCKTEAV